MDTLGGKARLLPEPTVWVVLKVGETGFGLIGFFAVSNDVCLMVSRWWKKRSKPTKRFGP
jgi:hypothetical protein